MIGHSAAIDLEIPRSRPTAKRIAGLARATRSERSSPLQGTEHRRATSQSVRGILLRFGLVLLPLLSGCANTSHNAGWLPDPALSSNQFTIRVWVTDPECPSKLNSDQVDIEITETDIAVVLLAKTPDHSTGACKASNVAVPVDVDLDAPLGSRLLLDGRFEPPAPPVDDYNAGSMPLE